MQYIKLASNRRCCTACLRKKTTQLGDLGVVLPRANSFLSHDLIMEHDINTAMRKGFFQQVRILAHLGCDVNACDSFGRTPLMNCALVEDGQWSVGLARTLLQHGAEPTTRDSHLGMSVMHFACVLGQLELVNFLLNSAPDIDLRAKDKRGNNPLHYAAATGNQHILTALLKVCSRYQMKIFDAKNKAGCTPLELAFTNEHIDCCNLLRSAQTSLVRQRPEIIDTASATPVDHVTALSAATSRRVSELTSASHGTSHYCNGNSQPSATAADERPHNGYLQPDDISSPQSVADRNVGRDNDTKAYTPIGPDHVTIDHHPTLCSLSMTATSARQRRTESRRLANRTVADMVDDQLRSTRSLRPNVAVRATRRMMLDMNGSAGRPVSAPNSGTPYPSSTQQPHQEDVIPAEVLQTRRLKSAMASDPRNKPFGNILSTPVVEFFAVTENKPNHPTTASNAMTSSDSNTSWRSKITQLYADYDYHFTTSYRRAAVPHPVQRRTSGTETTDADGVIRPTNLLECQRPVRPGGSRRTSAVKNGTGNSVETVSSGKKTNSTSSIASVAVAASQRSKRSSMQGIDTVDSAVSLRPKSGKFAAALLKKGR